MGLVLYNVNLVGTLSLVYLCGYLIRNPYPPDSPIYYKIAATNRKVGLLSLDLFPLHSLRCLSSWFLLV